MMSQNAIEGSTKFFAILDDYCANHGIPNGNSGSGRYVAGAAESVDFFVNAKLQKKIIVNPACRLMLMEYEDQKVVLTYGINGGQGLSYLVERDVGPGEMTCMILSHELLPVVDPATVSDFVGAGEIGLHGYVGHQIEDALSLFKCIRSFTVLQTEDIDFNRISFEIAIDAVEINDQWMGSELINDMKALSDLGLDLPFRNLTRSLSDNDPSSLFLSLYRCLEATYSYKVCSKLINELGLNLNWTEMYKIMDVEAKWRPRELESLEYILSLGSVADHAAVLEAIKYSTAKNKSRSADLIYDLRNSLVHFKPYQSIDKIYENIEWNKLCRAIAGYIFDIYQQIPKYSLGMAT